MPKKIMLLGQPAKVNINEVARLFKGSPKGVNQSTGKPMIGRDYNSHYLRMEPDARFKKEPSENGFQNLHEELKDRWEKMIEYGSIQVRLPFEKHEDCFFLDNTTFIKWGEGTRKATSCDGRTCTLSYTTQMVEKVVKGQKKNVKEYKFDRTPKPCMVADDGICPLGCSPKAWLRLIIPDFYPGGIVVFPLGSPIDIANIRGTLSAFEKHGLDRIPFSLFRKASRVNFADDRGDQSRDNWGVHLVLDGVVAARLAAKADRKFERYLESDSDIIDADTIEISQQRLIAPAKAPSFQKSDDGFNFLNQLRAAKNEGSIELLEKVLEIARELVESGFYDRSGLAWINQEEERARSAIRELAIPPASIALAIPNPKNAAQLAAAFFQKKTKIPTPDIRVMATRLNLPESSDMTGDDTIVLVGEILTCWAESEGVSREVADSLVMRSIESVGSENEALWADFDQRLEAWIADNSGG